MATSYKIQIICLACLLACALLLNCTSSLYAKQSQEEAIDADGLSLQEKRIAALLQQKIKELDQKEQAVQAKEKELKILVDHVENKLSQIKQARLALQEYIEQKQEIQDKKAKELSSIYENMHPARAAQALLSMQRELAIGILSNMRKKLAGKVLDQMQSEEAAEISRDYSNLGVGIRPP